MPLFGVARNGSDYPAHAAGEALQGRYLEYPGVSWMGRSSGRRQSWTVLDSRLIGWPWRKGKRRKPGQEQRQISTRSLGIVTGVSVRKQRLLELKPGETIPD